MLTWSEPINSRQTRHAYLVTVPMNFRETRHAHLVTESVNLETRPMNSRGTRPAYLVRDNKILRDKACLPHQSQLMNFRDKACLPGHRANELQRHGMLTYELYKTPLPGHKANESRRDEAQVPGHRADELQGDKALVTRHLYLAVTARLPQKVEAHQTADLNTVSVSCQAYFNTLSVLYVTFT